MNETKLVYTAIDKAIKSIEKVFDKNDIDLGYYDIRVTMWSKEIETGRRIRKWEFEDESPYEIHES